MSLKFLVKRLDNRELKNLFLNYGFVNWGHPTVPNPSVITRTFTYLYFKTFLIFFQVKKLKTAQKEHSKLLRNQVQYESQIGKLKSEVMDMKRNKVRLVQKVCTLESVQDFLIKLGIKPLMHLLEISTFSLNNVIVRLTKIMNRANKNWAHF